MQGGGGGDWKGSGAKFLEMKFMRSWDSKGEKIITEVGKIAWEEIYCDGCLSNRRW